MSEEDEFLEADFLPPRLNGHDELPLSLQRVLGEAGPRAATEPWGGEGNGVLKGG